MKTRLRRLRDVDPILIQAVIAAAISFSHIHDVAEAAGQAGWKAWAYPVSVDLLLVMAWKLIRAPKGEGASKVGPWIWFVLSLAASLGANVATAGVVDLTSPPTELRTLVAGWPVLAFFGGSLLIHGRKRQAEREVPREVLAEQAQLAAGGPEPVAIEEEAQATPPAPQKPILQTYAAVADRLGLAESTVRGWANAGHVKKHYDGDTPSRVYVDLRECTARHNNIHRTVGV